MAYIAALNTAPDMTVDLNAVAKGRQCIFYCSKNLFLEQILFPFMIHICPLFLDLGVPKRRIYDITNVLNGIR